MAVAVERAERPPDTRGGTAPLPAGVLGAGAAALVAVLGGTLLLQIIQALTGDTITPICNEQLAVGVERELPRGALGICNILTALRSPTETALLAGGIVLGLGALVVGFLMYKKMPTKRMREQCVAGAVLGSQAIVLAVVIFFFRAGNASTFTRNFLNFELLEGRVGDFINGAKNTIILAFGGEFGGIVIGLVLAMLMLSSRRVVRAPARAYVNFFRGTPLIWQLSVFYFGFALGFGIDVSTFTAGLVVFSLNTGAYAAEVFRAGIQSIERGQMEAARSLGMSYMQAMRYAIVPQAVRRVIPPLMNEFVILIKDTSLIVILGLVERQYDLFTTARSGYSEFGNATFFVAAALGYLAVTLPLIRVVNYVESKMRSGMVGAAAR
jgi:His/Glu/Gln/Arg/opine family amino acid ABC transporter permease subunit